MDSRAGEVVNKLWLQFTDVMVVGCYSQKRCVSRANYVGTRSSGSCCKFLSANVKAHEMVQDRKSVGPNSRRA